MKTWLLFFMAVGVLASGGCFHARGIHQVGNWGPATLIEDGGLKSLYVYQTENYNGPALFYVYEMNRYSNLMGETPTRWNDKEIDNTTVQSLWSSAPPWRREENLQIVAQRMTADVGETYDRYMLSSHSPVVIGISSRQERTPVDLPYPYFRLLVESHPALPFIIDRMYVCDEWPKPDKSLGIPADRQLIVLKTPMTFEAALDARPWEAK